MAAPKMPPKTPIERPNRLDFLDILRGLAVLAIFFVNIKSMFAPFPYYTNPTLWPGEYDMLVATLQTFFIDDKWRTIFTLLFGTGIALMTERFDRQESQEKASTALLMRRLGFLAGFGLIHLLLIWNGDILFVYAISGLVLLAFRQMDQKNLARWITILFAINFIWMMIFDLGPTFDQELLMEVSGYVWGTDLWYIEEAKNIALGNISDQMSARLSDAGAYIFLYYLLGGRWLETLIIMLSGMWLFRHGFFNPAFPKRRYLNLAVIGLGIAFTLDTIRLLAMHLSEWSFNTWSWTETLNRMDGYFGAVGYMGLVGFLIAMGWRPKMLMATGRMAFTNYIACSLIGTSMAYGHGLKMFGTLTNLQLMGLAGAISIAILFWSTIWLTFFRFGPLEWIWRSLTYGQPQKLRA